MSRRQVRPDVTRSLRAEEPSNFSINCSRRACETVFCVCHERDSHFQHGTLRAAQSHRDWVPRVLSECRCLHPTIHFRQDWVREEPVRSVGRWKFARSLFRAGLNQSKRNQLTRRIEVASCHVCAGSALLVLRASNNFDTRLCGLCCMVQEKHAFSDWLLCYIRDAKTELRRPELVAAWVSATPSTCVFADGQFVHQCAKHVDPTHLPTDGHAVFLKQFGFPTCFGFLTSRSRLLMTPSACCNRTLACSLDFSRVVVSHAPSVEHVKPVPVRLAQMPLATSRTSRAQRKQPLVNVEKDIGCPLEQAFCTLPEQYSYNKHVFCQSTSCRKTVHSFHFVHALPS